jgi:hypothetical protein
MNYIYSLKSQIENLKSEVRRLNRDNDRLNAYLHSDKFKNDTTVQVGDIINILRENKNNSLVWAEDIAPKWEIRISIGSTKTDCIINSLNQVNGLEPGLYDLVEKCIETGETVWSENGDIACYFSNVNKNQQ